MKRKMLNFVFLILSALCIPLCLNANDIATIENNIRKAKDRKLVLTSDGKIVAFYCKGSTSGGPLYCRISSDGGVTWLPSEPSEGTLIGGTNWDAYRSSVWKDSSDHIYVVYCYNNDVMMKKMTYSAGSYTPGAERTVALGTETLYAPQVSIAVSGTRIWVSYTYNANGSPDAEVRARYSDNEGATWSGYSTVYSCYYGRNAIIIMGNGYPAVFGDNSYIPWSYWTGTSWSAKAIIPNTTDVYEDFSVCVISSYIHLLYSEYGGNIKHTYYDGASWFSPNTLQSSASRNPALVTDGVNLWCFWSNAGSGAADIVYKKYNGSWDSTTTLYSSGGNNYRSAVPYSIGGDNAIIPVFWYEGTANPYIIRFSKLGFSPKVTGISPTTGENSTPTTVTITGQGFFGGVYSSDITSVKLDDTFNTALNIFSATITDLIISNAIVPAGVKAGTYNIKVTTSKGTNTTSSQKFIVTTNIVPTVMNLVPDRAGNTGVTEIAIHGTGFFGGTTSGTNPVQDVRDIRLSDGANTQIATGTVVSDTQINNCIVPSGVVLGTYNVKVYTGGENNTTSTVQLRIVTNPTVTTLSSTTAPNNQPTTLDINGTAFWGGSSSSDVEWIKIASIDGLYQTNVTFISSNVAETIITGAVIPAQCHAGTYNVRVSTSSGGNNATSVNKFTVTTTVIPTVTNLVPDTGNNLYQTSTISIYGSGFHGGTGTDDIREIKLGASITITKGTVSNDTSIINCIVPSSVAVGTYDVKVTTGGGVATSAVQYKVTAMPTVSTISKITGSNLIQHTGLAITGNNFTGWTSMSLSGIMEVTISTFHFVDDTSIDNVMIPGGILAGTYDIRVTTLNGTNVASSQKWISTTDLPHLTSISPNAGSNANSTTISLAGSVFFGGTYGLPDIRAITLSKGALSTDLINCTVVSDTSGTGVVPSGLLVGIYNVKVTTGGGSSTEVINFNVATPIPVVTQITPNKGSREEDVTIDIKGTGFFGGTPSSQVISIKINNIDLSGYNVFDDNNIFHSIILLKSLDTGRYPVIVETVGGTSSLEGPKYDILFKADADYSFSKSGVSLSIPANTFSEDTAIIIEDRLTDSDLEKVSKADKLKYLNMKINVILDNTVRKIESTEAEISDGKSLSLTMSYSGIDDSVIEKKFRTVRLNNEGKWEYVSSDCNVDTANKEVETAVSSLSIFRIVQYVEPSNNLNDVVVYPNPIDFSLGTGVVKFVNLTANPRLRVYTISGELVKEILPDTIGNSGNDGRIEFDGKNEVGEVIKRGIYIFLITDESCGRKVGKFVVK
ncbi:MAG: IPT/TIG domain-containing protein [Candidatus Firestonebacteria bacterium]